MRAFLADLGVFYGRARMYRETFSGDLLPEQQLERLSPRTFSLKSFSITPNTLKQGRPDMVANAIATILVSAQCCREIEHVALAR